jgi:hypothetical protein
MRSPSIRSDDAKGTVLVSRPATASKGLPGASECAATTSLSSTEIVARRKWSSSGRRHR